jgi:hypothetical protein
MRPTGRLVFVLALSPLLLAACWPTKVEVAQGRWMATCTDVRVADCRDIAELFVNNLARNEEAIRRDANSVMSVARMSSCPVLPDWAVPECWRAEARTRAQRARMVIARQTIGAGGAFGQAGGDVYTGLLGAPAPGTTPC